MIQAKDTTANTWYQIHTNGAVSTFARWWAGMTDTGEPAFAFEKLQVDHTDSGSGSAVIFGGQEFGSVEGAVNRLEEALATGV